MPYTLQAAASALRPSPMVAHRKNQGLEGVRPTLSFLEVLTGTILPMLGAGRTSSGSSWDVHHLQRVAPLVTSSRQWGHFTLGAFGCACQLSSSCQVVCIHTRP